MRFRIHTTAVAYAALFIALGGSGYAATRIATAASSGVKVRCRASHGGKRVACKVVKGSGVGPPGPRGLQGPPGASGAAGPTMYTEPPAFSFFAQTPGTTAIGVNEGSLQDEDEFENLALFLNSAVPASDPGEPIVRMWLQSPSELDGSPGHLQSIGFCYGGQTEAGVTAQLVEASVVEYIENGSLPVPTNTAQPPAYNAVTLYSAPLTGIVPAGLNGAGGCTQVTPPSPVAIQPDGTLALDLTYKFIAPSGGDIQVTFGRVSTTYAP